MHPAGLVVLVEVHCDAVDLILAQRLTVDRRADVVRLHAKHRVLVAKRRPRDAATCANSFSELIKLISVKRLIHMASKHVNE